MNYTDLTKPPFSIPGFAFERLLGSGAAGDVYLARQNLGDGPPAYRAVKILNLNRLRHDLVDGRMLAKEQLEAVEAVVDDVRRRFIAESHIGPALCHPAFVQYYPGGAVDDNPYIVMEYVPGLSAYDYVRSHVLSARPFSRSIRAENALREIARIGYQLASGLEFAHAQGVVHRDIKPENILVAVDPAGLRSARAKILDLGIAKIPPAKLGDLPVTHTLTIQGFLGTPVYMAPEQRGTAETSDGRADVFALGQTLLFLMTDHLLEWGSFLGVSRSGPHSAAPLSSDKVARASAAVLRWIRDAVPLAPGETPAGALDEAIQAWGKLLVRMIRPDRAERLTMRQVAVELQLIARSGGDEASSDPGREFARAVYDWETTRSLPQNEADLGRYLRWAVREELTPSEEQFLRAYEHDVSQRRLRAQEDAEAARVKAVEALRVAKANYRRARTWLYNSACLAVIAVLVGVIAVKQWRSARDAEAWLGRQNAHHQVEIDALEQAKAIYKERIRSLEELLNGSSGNCESLVKEAKTRLAWNESALKVANQQAAQAHKEAANAKKTQEIAEESQGLAQAKLEKCEQARSRCVNDVATCAKDRDNLKQCRSDLVTCSKSAASQSDMSKRELTKVSSLVDSSSATVAPSVATVEPATPSSSTVSASPSTSAQVPTSVPQSKPPPPSGSAGASSSPAVSPPSGSVGGPPSPAGPPPPGSAGASSSPTGPSPSGSVGPPP